jgi:hypothetical protein
MLAIALGRLGIRRSWPLTLGPSPTAYEPRATAGHPAAIVERARARGAHAQRQPTWRAAAVIKCRQADRDRSRCVPATLSLTGGD